MKPTKPIQQLKSLAMQNVRDKHPNLPEIAVSCKPYSDKTANGLTKCVTDFINFSGGQAERIGNTGRYVDNRITYEDAVGYKTIGKAKWIRGSGTNGTADISAVIKGKSVKIEVKIGRDKQSEAQRIYQQKIEQAGGIYWIVKTFDDFYGKYTQLIENS